MFSTLTAIHAGLYWRESMEMEVCELEDLYANHLYMNQEPAGERF